jgi:molybdenum cofactor cytidylyltransferase
LSEAQPRIAAIVLAAGRSTRMGAQNKLLADIGSKPMVRHVVETVLASRAAPVLVVTGHMAGDVTPVLAKLDIVIVENPDFATGLASSLKAGIEALPDTCDGALIVLGDMPRIEASHIDRLLEAFAPDTIIVPTHEKRIGNPVLWPAHYFPELLQLEGDAGARRLLDIHADRVRKVPLATDAIFSDIDTPEALAQLRGRQ